MVSWRYILCVFGMMINCAWAIEIDIKKADFTGYEDIFLEAILDKKKVYIGEQFILTIKFYRAVDLRSGELTEPELSSEVAIVERLGEDRHFEVKHYTQPYIITERKYAIFAKNSGELTIPRVVFSGDIIKGRVSVFDAFDAKIQRKQLATKPLIVTVLPKPEMIQGDWLPASDLMISQFWSPIDLKIEMGTPVTRTIQIGANGVMLNQLPEIKSIYPAAFKVYIDQGSPVEQKSDNGFTTQKEYKIVLMATAPGQYRFPDIRIPWWDTTTQTLKWAEALGRDIEVLPVVDAIRTVEPAVVKTASTSHFWQWATMVLSILWFSSLIFNWFFWKKNKKINLKKIKKLIKKSALQNNFKLCSNFLLQWANLNWPDRKFYTIADIQKIITGSLGEELIKLNEILYAKDQRWNGNQFWLCFDAYQNNFAPLYDNL